MPSSVLFTSKNQEYETPDDFFRRIDSTYHFTLDACAKAHNAKCSNYFSPEDDGLTQSWAGHSVWLNPPYEPARKLCRPNCKKHQDGAHVTASTPGQIAWVRKAHDEVKYNNCKVVVCLLPARTDTKLFHDYVMKSSLVCFIRGRLKFVGAPTSSVFPSMLVTFESWQRNDVMPFPKFTTMNLK